MSTNQPSAPYSAISSAKFKPLLIASGIVIVAMFAVSWWAWGQVPAGAEIPVHWGVDGQPDRYGGKFEGLMLMPLIVLAVAALLCRHPSHRPPGRQYPALRGRVSGHLVGDAGLLRRAAWGVDPECAGLQCQRGPVCARRAWG